MRNMRQQVLILAGSQAIFQSISVLIMTIGGLAGALLTPNPSLVTVPISMASLHRTGDVSRLFMDGSGRQKNRIHYRYPERDYGRRHFHGGHDPDSFILLCLGMFFWEYTGPLRSFSVLLRVKLRCRHSAPGPFRWFWLAVLLLPC